MAGFGVVLAATLGCLLHPETATPSANTAASERLANLVLIRAQWQAPARIAIGRSRTLQFADIPVTFRNNRRTVPVLFIDYLYVGW